MLPELWPAALPFIARALKVHPFLNSGALLAQLLRGKAALIVFVDGGLIGAAVMEATAYPPDTVGNVIAIGGVKDSYRRYGDEVAEALERWCRRQNCTKMAALGRQGWSRYLARRGWRTQTVVCAWKDLR
jgi:hypothetical protein